MNTVTKSDGKRKAPAKGGSRKGIPNKITSEVKTMVLEALEGVGGVSYLMERAQDPRTAPAFMTLVGKVIPLQVAGDPDNPVKHSITISFK